MARAAAVPRLWTLGFQFQAELFASQQQHIMQLYCSKKLNNALRLFRKAINLVYANPPLSLLATVLTKIAYEGGRVVTEAGSDPRGHCWVTLGVYLWAGKPPLADIILSHPPDLT